MGGEANIEARLVAIEAALERLEQAIVHPDGDCLPLGMSFYCITGCCEDVPQ